MGNKSGNCYNSTPNEEMIEIRNKQNYNSVPMKKIVSEKQAIEEPMSQLIQKEEIEDNGNFEKIELDDGKIITGHMVNGQIQSGIIEYPNGDRFNGEINQNCACGEGDITYANGDWYKGQFNKDLRSGFGKMNFTSGNTYEGNFSDNIFNGYGNFTFQNGNSFQGKLINYLINY